jgi:uncharacterized protein (DUF1501 family)
MDRRELLKWMSLAGGASFAPGWAWSMSEAEAPAHRLIVLFLRGGADGLALCPPLGESAYFDLRPTLASSESQALPLNSFFGFHPAAGSLKSLFDAGELSVVHASGLMTAERSHFEAQAIMEQGIDASDMAVGDGWLGRYMATLNGGSPLAAVALDAAVPLSMAGLDSALSLGQIDRFSLRLDARSRMVLESLYGLDPLLSPTARAVFQAADSLASAQSEVPGPDYPAGPLGIALSDAARLIKADSGLHAAAVNTGGWDTHEGQLEDLDGLISELGDALLAFRNDIGSQWQKTTVVVQTEFGRRVAENASGGTDHGHGGVMLLAGGQVDGGQVLGNWPGLHTSALSDGQDLAVTTDYRQVIAEILADRFGVSDFSPIFGSWQPGPWHGLFRASRPHALTSSWLGKSSPMPGGRPDRWQAPDRLDLRGLGRLRSLAQGPAGRLGLTE